MARHIRSSGVALLLLSIALVKPAVAVPTWKAGTLLFVEVYPDGSWDFGFTPAQTLCSSATDTTRGMVQSSWVTGSSDVVKQMQAVDDNPGGRACKVDVAVIQTY
jgi:hypothetical protein